MIRTLAPVIAIAGAAALLAACGSSSNNNNTKSAATAPPAAASATRAAPVSAPSTAQASAATPATNPVERVSGTVQTISGDKIALKGGGGFTLTAQTAITKRAPSSVSALKSGSVVAVTAKRQPDNTLLASLIVVFPAAPGGGSFFGQRPLDAGNLMTNATVDKVDSYGFSVTFPGGGAQVTLAPDGQVQTIAVGTQADVKEGAMIIASVKDGVAQAVSIQ